MPLQPQETILAAEPRPNPAPLSYAAIDTPSLNWENGRLRIDLGPMSGWEIAAVLLPSVLWSVAAGGFVGLGVASGGHRSGLLAAVVLAVMLSLCLVSLWFVFRIVTFRRVPRVIWACPTRLGYSDCRSGGRAVLTRHSSRFSPVMISRSWWRPWVCELWVRPVISQSGLGRSYPVVLAVASDRTRLRRVGAIIERAKIPAEPAHVKGAFEVVPLRPTPPGSDQSAEPR